MIRRDYILRMIEEFVQVLARIRSLKKEQHWQEAEGTVEQQLEKLIGGGTQSLLQLSEIELLAKLAQAEPSQALHEKTAMLATLLKEAGELTEAHGTTHQSQALYLKGLKLVLHALAQGGPCELPEFVPTVEAFLGHLDRSALPLQTHAQLMQHYERLGQFAKAEDAFFAMLEQDPKHPELVEFGISFYHRLHGHSDATLIAGNLPRSELEAGLAELKARKSRPPAIVH